MNGLIALVQPLVDRWQAGDFRPPPGGLAPDLVLTGFTPSGDDRVEGADEIASYLRQFFAEWREYRMEARNVVALDDQHVLIEGRQYGTGRTSGIVIDETLFVVVRVREGLVCAIHWHAYRDGAFHAAGLSSP